MIGTVRRSEQEFADEEAVVGSGDAATYRQLFALVDGWSERLMREGVREGATVAIEADFSASAIALFLALVQHRCILVPLAAGLGPRREELLRLARAQVIVRPAAGGAALERTTLAPDHPHLDTLRRRGHPGLVLFSSGSTGRSKAAVHDLTFLLEKFTFRRRRLRCIPFLLFDHVGGINTMLYTLSNGGCLVTVPDRRPDTVLEAVERFGVQLLPTSPTFLNLVLVSEAWRRHDLSTLELVTYGTEPMPESTLRRLRAALPHVRLQQTYGLSEIGILRSKSRSSDSLWVKIGGEGFETRVVDGMLQVKARSAMLGYLNAEDPFTEDGWLVTGDAVEVDGEWIRILGRRSELINVGGEKVYPAEVESVIQEMEGVSEAVVYGEKNALMGQVVCARVRGLEDLGRKELTARVQAFCRSQLERFKVPVKVTPAAAPQHGQRFKKMRS